METIEIGIRWRRHDPLLEKLVEALDKKVCSQGIKLYFQLSEYVATTSALTDEKRAAFLARPYDQDPIAYFEGFGPGTKEKLAKIMQKEEKDLKTDDVFAYILALLPIDPSLNYEASNKIQNALTKELGMVAQFRHPSTLIDQFQCRLAVGLDLKDQAAADAADAYRQWRLTWRRDPATGRIKRVEAASPPGTSIGKKAKQS